MNKAIQETRYDGEKAVVMRFGKYEAIVLPELGANLISFTDVEREYRFIRSPPPGKIEHFKSNPTSYGIPVLFPPNRYEQGRFTIDGITYQFPMNEKKYANHLHGLLYNRPWNVSDKGAYDSEVYIVIEQNVDEEHEVYKYYPHKFKFTIRYSLTGAGLFQKVTIKNNGLKKMPCMLGFHTAINVPFTNRSSAQDYRLIVTIGKRFELNHRMLPTGRYQTLDKQEQMMKTTGVHPLYKPMDHHYTAHPQENKNYMKLTDLNEKVSFIYDVGLKYKHWMLWNSDASSGFICPEPQTNIVNAPNLNLPFDRSGIYILEPGEEWFEESKMTIQNIQ